MASTTYDAANQIATWGGVQFTHDANGNLTNDGVRGYTWNARNQLASLTGPVNASFAYDAFGRRRSRTVTGTSKSFLYDEWNLVQELTGGTASANLLTGLNIDETFVRAEAAGASALLADGLGSTLEVADASGTLHTHYTFEPFGATTTVGASSNPAQFAGRENDATGLYHYRFRYYHPTLQRFISEDPIEFAGGDVNLYAYVGNGPTQFTDPLGLQVFVGATPPWLNPLIIGGRVGPIRGPMRPPFRPIRPPPSGRPENPMLRPTEPRPSPTLPNPGPPGKDLLKGGRDAWWAEWLRKWFELIDELMKGGGAGGTTWPSPPGGGPGGNSGGAGGTGGPGGSGPGGGVGTPGGNGSGPGGGGKSGPRCRGWICEAWPVGQ
jgi:RHS repeat-associated protein